jgi:hypothetical protein
MLADMTKRDVLTRLLLFGALFAIAVQAQKSATEQPPEQTTFGAGAAPGEALISRPVEIPDGALQFLRDTLGRGTVNCIKNVNGLTPERVPASWFVASEIHLDGPNEADLIVRPRDLEESPSPNRCLFGAHVVPFWVLRNRDGKYDLLLQTGGDGLQVLDSRTKGYRDIKAVGLTAVSITFLRYQFNGEKYQPSEREAKSGEKP